MDNARMRQTRNDGDAQDGRIERLLWLEQHLPNLKRARYRGAGSAALFEVSCDCFVDGRYPESIVLALAFIKRSLTTALCRAGGKELQQAGFPELARGAMRRNWIAEAERAALLDAWRRGISIAGHRRPGGREKMKARASRGWPPPFHDLLEQDAMAVIDATLKVLPKAIRWCVSEKPKALRFGSRHAYRAAP
jgi:hypothetical protein